MLYRAETTAERLCPHCGAADPVGLEETVWLLNLRCAACGHDIPVQDGIPFFAPDLAGTATGFDVAAFDRLAAVEAGHYWFEPRNRLLVGLAERFFPNARHYLEVGCGTGFVLDAFSRARHWVGLTGSELHPQGLVHARRRLGDRAQFIQMDARAIPARGAFDLVGVYDVLEHISEDESVLASIAGSLADGGGIIVSVPQHPCLWSRADDEAHHVRRYRLGELEGKMRAASFDVLWSTSYVVSLLPLMVASRVAKRRSSTDQLASREFNVGPFMNGALRAVLDAEAKLSMSWIKWPVGGSRVVVGRKRNPARKNSNGPVGTGSSTLA